MIIWPPVYRKPKFFHITHKDVYLDPLLIWHRRVQLPSSLSPCLQLPFSSSRPPSLHPSSSFTLSSPSSFSSFLQGLPSSSLQVPPSLPSASSLPRPPSHQFPPPCSLPSSLLPFLSVVVLIFVLYYLCFCPFLSFLSCPFPDSMCREYKKGRVMSNRQFFCPVIKSSYPGPPDKRPVGGTVGHH